MGDSEYLLVFYALILPVVREFKPDYLFISAGGLWRWTIYIPVLSRLWCPLRGPRRHLPGHSWSLWSDDSGDHQAISMHRVVKLFSKELNKVMGGKNLILTLEGRFQMATYFIVIVTQKQKVVTTLQLWEPPLFSVPRPCLVSSLRGPGRFWLHSFHFCLPSKNRLDLSRPDYDMTKELPGKPFSEVRKHKYAHVCNPPLEISFV